MGGWIVVAVICVAVGVGFGYAGWLLIEDWRRLVRIRLAMPVPFSLLDKEADQKFREFYESIGRGENPEPDSLGETLKSGELKWLLTSTGRPPDSRKIERYGRCGGLFGAGILWLIGGLLIFWIIMLSKAFAER